MNGKTPSYLMASYLRDTVKTSFQPEADHVERVYEAARAVEQHDVLAAFVADYIAAEEAAAIQWKKDYPKFPWKPDHEAMKRLERARAALSQAEQPK